MAKHSFAREPAVAMQCHQCGQPILVWPSNIRRSKTGHFFCGKACQDESRRGKALVAPAIVPCSVCGKDVAVRPGLARTKKRFFCSATCKAAFFEIDVACVQCGKVVRRRRKEVEAMTRGPFCSSRCHGAWVAAQGARRGARNPAWRGGYTSPNYNYDWKRQRNRARERDHNTCQDCGATSQEHGYLMDVHHIVDYDLFEDPAEANRLENLITLCRVCHVKRHQRGT